jgi:hypothetical protein
MTFVFDTEPPIVVAVIIIVYVVEAVNPVKVAVPVPREDGVVGVSFNVKLVVTVFVSCDNPPIQVKTMLVGYGDVEEPVTKTSVGGSGGGGK